MRPCRAHRSHHIWRTVPDRGGHTCWTTLLALFWTSQRSGHKPSRIPTRTVWTTSARQSSIRRGTAATIHRFHGTGIYCNDYHGALAAIYLLPGVISVCLALHQKSVGVAGVSDKCSKCSWAWYPALKHVDSLPNPDTTGITTLTKIQIRFKRLRSIGRRGRRGPSF